MVLDNQSIYLYWDAYYFLTIFQYIHEQIWASYNL
jgi:hypothetical protein